MSLKGKEIYFDPDNGRLPVPNYLYKIITIVSTGEKEVYVINNNPYESIANIHNQINQTFDKKAIELTDDYVDVTKGYTFKVAFDDFVKIVDVGLNDPNYRNYAIPLSYGEIRVKQHHELLNILQVSYNMPMTAGKVKGIIINDFTRKLLR